MNAKNLTPAQTNALNSREPNWDVRPAMVRTVTGRKNTLDSLVRLQLATWVTPEDGSGKVCMLTDAGELVAAPLSYGDRVSIATVDAAIASVEGKRPDDATYYPHAEQVRTLSEAREFWIDRKRVSVVVEGMGRFTTLFLGGEILWAGETPAGVKSPGDLYTWARVTAPAIVAQRTEEAAAKETAAANEAAPVPVGARVSTPMGRATVTGYNTALGVLLLRRDEQAEGAEPAMIAADSPHLYRVCIQCDTVGDDSMPSRETADGHLCGYCAAFQGDNTTEPSAPVQDVPTATVTVRYHSHPMKRGDVVVKCSAHGEIFRTPCTSRVQEVYPTANAAARTAQADHLRDAHPGE